MEKYIEQLLQLLFVYLGEQKGVGELSNIGCVDEPNIIWISFNWEDINIAVKVEIDDGNVPKYDLHFLPREDHDEVDYKVVKEQAERLQILMNGIQQVVQKCEDDKKKAQLKKKQLKDFETFFDSQY